MTTTIICRKEKPAEVDFWESLPSSEADFTTLKEYHNNYWGDRFQILGVSPDNPNVCTYQFTNSSMEELNNFYTELCNSSIMSSQYKNFDYESENHIDVYIEILNQ